MSASTISAVLRPRERDLGDFAVRRVLPSARQPMIGPFIFFDHMGPAEFAPGKGIDVRPHPHINLATVTYLFEGSLHHRDSLGESQNIEPGAVNWMTAGRGIVHSERSDDASRAAHSRIHGIQSWLALPAEHEEIEPAFVHHPKDTLPAWREGGARFRLIAGEYAGHESPVETLWPMFYVDCQVDEDATHGLDDRFTERAAYIVEGALSLDGETFGSGEMVIFAPDQSIELQLSSGARIMLLGGEPSPEPRHLWWNFVSSRPARIELAKADWANGRFGSVPGDDSFIPLPKS